MKNHATCLGFVLGTFLSSSSLFAQPCLTAKPAPACRSCFITEFGYGYKLTSPLKSASISWVGDSVTYAYEPEVTGRHYLTSELGYMRNLNSQYSLGFTHFTRWDIGHNLRGGMKLRVRRWLNQKTSVDLSGGMILWGIEDSDLKRSAFIGGASVNFSDWEAVNVQIEVLETQPYDYSYSDFNGVQSRSFSPRRRNVGVYLSYKLSSKPGLVLNGVALVTFGVVFAIFAATFHGS
jgi:hypothetical protein